MAPVRRASLSLLILGSILATSSNAQNCYYPNGDVSTTDGACNADGWETCCPLNWQCLSNGLCQLSSEGYYGRYTCTNQAWDNNSCPQYCTQNGTAAGNEAILLCANGLWCCDGDRSSNCCNADNADYFTLADRGSVIASITSLASATPVSTTSPRSTSDQASSAPTVSSAVMSRIASTQPASSTGQMTTTFLSTSSDSSGQISTITVVSIASDAATSSGEPQPHSSGSGSSTETLAIGLAVPLGVIVLSAVLFLLWKRRYNRKHQQSLNRPPLVTTAQNDYADGDHKYAKGHFPPEGRAPELDSYPVAPVRTKSGRLSELMGSSIASSSPVSPQMRSKHSPSLSVGLPPPPSYGPSPLSSPRAGGGDGGSPAAPGTPFSTTLRAVNEEPQELWGGYVPYRPPQPQSGEHHGANGPVSATEHREGEVAGQQSMQGTKSERADGDTGAGTGGANGKEGI